MIRLLQRLARTYFAPNIDRKLAQELMELFPETLLAVRRNGVIVGLNKSFAEKTGRQYDHIIGSSVLEHLDDAESKEILCAYLNEPNSSAQTILRWSGVHRKCIVTEASIGHLQNEDQNSEFVLLKLIEKSDSKKPLLLAMANSR